MRRPGGISVEAAVACSSAIEFNFYSYLLFQVISFKATVVSSIKCTVKFVQICSTFKIKVELIIKLVGGALLLADPPRWDSTASPHIKNLLNPENCCNF